MKLSQLSLADYNQLDSIPVINQDLSATDFTPVANTYYRHTGTTTDTFTQGVIYLYDTAYHKLGEGGGGGGTTLNRYEATLDELVNNAQGSQLLHRILTTAKGNYTVYNYGSTKIYDVLDRGTVIDLRNYTTYSASIELMSATLKISDGSISNNFIVTVSGQGLAHSSLASLRKTRVVYWNDTEIT